MRVVLEVGTLSSLLESIAVEESCIGSVVVMMNVPVDVVES